MKMRHGAFIMARAVLVCVLATTAQAGDTLTERLSAVAAGQTITLANSGEAVFANLVFPDGPAADAWIANHLLQQEITFKITGTDRYGRSRIQADVAEDMLQAGVAVIYSFAHPPKKWQAAEDAARLAKRGVWGREGFVLTPENAAQHIGEFHVVEGVIRRTYYAKSASYLNFGDDWHSDFSVTIPGKFRRGFADLLPQLKEGAKVRVRGSIYEENGPMIKLTKPEQIEFF
jgi:endonuclease YncB( thermonuclease family)